MKWILSFLLLALPAMGGREFSTVSTNLAVCQIQPIDTPITLAVWVKPNRDDQPSVLLALNSSTNNSELLRIYLNGTGDTFGISAYNASASGVNTAGGSFNTNSWFSVAGVFSSSSLRTLYVGGSPVVTNTTSRTADGLDSVVLASVKFTSGYIDFLSGVLGEAAVWDVALTASEILSISVGASPLLIRPANLKFYSPLSNREASTEVNYVGAAISLTNAPLASALHPRIYKP